jgi:hypothetical protein
VIVSQLLAAYRVIREQERKKRQYEALVGTEVNYTIIRDLINTAQHDVVVHVTFKDGTAFDIRREDPFDRFKDRQARNRGADGEVLY